VREVYLFIFIISIFIGGVIYLNKTTIEIYLINVIANLLIIVTVNLILFFYVIIIFKKKFFEAIGLGDILFFILLGVSFPVTSFLMLFSSSLIFSLIVFLIIKSYLKQKTVPLAGMQALFLFFILVLNQLFNVVYLYTM